MSMHLKPILKAMLLCDSTIIEADTRKRSIIGIFDRIRGHQFPVTHPAMSVYVQFLGVEGQFDFVLELVDLRDNRVTNRAEVKAYKVLDKTRECELVFNLSHIKFIHPGEYEFRIYISDNIFGQKTIKVLE